MAEEYPDILADMTTSVQLTKHSKGLRPSMPSTQHLLALETCVPSQTSVLPAYLCNIVTSLNIQAWEWELRAHPDQPLVSYILRGIQDGLPIEATHVKLLTATCSQPMNTLFWWRSIWLLSVQQAESLAPYQFKHFQMQ